MAESQNKTKLMNSVLKLVWLLEKLKDRNTLELFDHSGFS